MFKLNLTCCLVIFVSLITRMSFGCGCSHPQPQINPPLEGLYLSNCRNYAQYFQYHCVKSTACEYCNSSDNHCYPYWYEAEGCEAYYDYGAPQNSPDINKPQKQCGSVINVNSLTVGEVIPITGTDLTLVYHSNRVAGFKEGFTYSHNIDQGASAPDLEKIHITDTYLGSGISNDYLPNVYPAHSFTWNGLDHSSNLVTSAINVELKVEYEHTGSVMTTEYVQNIPVGNFQAKAIGLGGWTLSNVHFYDPIKKALYLGAGDTKSVVAYKVQETSGEYAIQDDTDPENPAVFSHYLVLSDDKSESYIFNPEGFHIKTLSVEENETLLTIGYDINNKLESITDDKNNEIEITRTSTVVTIETPNGKITTINLDVNGWAEEVIDPLVKKHEMTYSADGLMLSFKNPEGLVSTFTYDSEGRLEEDSNTAGHEITFDVLSAVPNASREVSSTSKLGRVTNYNTSYQ